MVLIPRGQFQMGSRIGARDEKPRHPVTLPAYRIDVHEVTNAQYDRFQEWMKGRRDHSLCAPGEEKGKDHTRKDFGPDFNGDTQPVVGVDWFDAFAYAVWAGKRLPTEAEWERAARGLEGYIYPWGNYIDPVGARFGGKVPHPAPVGTHREGISPAGAMDMAGNVWEWCMDWYQEDIYTLAGELDPTGPFRGETRVLRGGSWLDFASSIRSAFRGNADPLSRSNHIGFRCASSTR